MFNQRPWYTGSGYAGSGYVFPYCYFLYCEVRDMLAKAYQILEIGKKKSETRNSFLLSKFQAEVLQAQI